jgi:hypothetical protein
MVIMSTGVNKCRLQRVLLIILRIQFHDSIHNWHYLLRAAIVKPHASPWKSLFAHDDAALFLQMTGLSQEAFRSLLGDLFDLESIARYRRHGRPCLLAPAGYLGLLLFYLGVPCRRIIFV